MAKPKKKPPRIYWSGGLSGELLGESVLQDLGTVDPLPFGHVRHPRGNGYVFPHRAGIRPRPVGNRVNAYQCQHVRPIVGDFRLGRGQRDRKPLILPDHQTTAQGVGDLGNRVLNILASGDAAGNVRNPDIAFPVFGGNNCGNSLAHS